MGGPGTPEPNQHEVPGVVSTLDGHQSKGVHHRGVGNLDNSVRRAFDRQAEWFRTSLANRLASTRKVKRHFATGKVVRVEPAKHQVGVGNSRFSTAKAIANRPGFGSCRMRPNPQRPAGIDPRYRTTTGTYFDEVHDRSPNRVARRSTERPGAVLCRAANTVILRHMGLSIADEAGLGGRTAHVERYDIRVPQRRSERRRRDCTCSRTGFDHEHRRL